MGTNIAKIPITPPINIYMPDDMAFLNDPFKRNEKIKTINIPLTSQAAKYICAMAKTPAASPKSRSFERGISWSFLSSTNNQSSQSVPNGKLRELCDHNVNDEKLYG